MSSMIRIACAIISLLIVPPAALADRVAIIGTGSVGNSQRRVMTLSMALATHRGTMCRRLWRGQEATPRRQHRVTLCPMQILLYLPYPGDWRHRLPAIACFNSLALI